MRPISIRIKGFRSFTEQSPADIDFGARDQLAIIGNTGAGKSSVLEAMTYALYGQTSFAGKATQEIVNDESQQAEIAFTFWAGTHVWESVRTLSRRKNGEVAPGSAMLRRFGDSDETLETIEGVQAVNQQTAELLGMDAAAFLRTMILPQGRFARLLAEDEPRNRAQILRQIWRSDELDAAGGVLHKAEQRVHDVIAKATAVRDQHPEDLDGHATNLDAEHERSRTETRKARGRAAAFEATSARILRTIETRASIEQAAAAIESDGPSRAMLEDIAGTAAELDELAAAAERSEAAARNRLGALERPDTAEVQRIDALRATIGNAASAAADYRREAAALNRATETVIAAHEKAQEAAERVADAERADKAAGGGRMEALERALAEARERLNDAGRRYDRHTLRYTEGIATARRELDELAERKRATAERAEETGARAAEACGTAAAALEALDELLQHNAAAHAAAGYEPGDECPVCGSTLTDGWTPPAENAIGEARTAARCGQAAADRAAREHAQATSVAEHSARAHAQAEARVGKLEAEEVEQRGGLLLLLDTAEEELGTRRTALAPLAAACDKAADELEQVRKATLATRAAVERARADEKNAAAGLAGATAAMKEQRGATGAARAEVEKANARLQDSGDHDLREAVAAAVASTDRVDWPAVPAHVIADTEARLGSRQADLLGQMETWNDASTKLRAASDDIAAIRRRRVEQVETPLEKAIEQGAAWRETVLAAARAIDPDGATPAPVGGRTAAKVLAALDAVGDTATAARETARKRLTELERSAAEATAEAADAWSGRQDWSAEGIEATAADLAARCDEAMGAEAAARQRRDAFAAARGGLARLDALIAGATTLHGQLHEVRDALRPGRFPKWLTLRRSTILLEHASQQLEAMSDGRYRFCDPRDTGEQWKIRDAWTGGVRTPSTLSGGEQFMASLALALGMVETMGERGGRVECFFLDEGFGTLDRTALDEALDALDRATAPDHMVGVITHVREVAERIEAVLLVEREPGRGSRTRWLEDAERDALLQNGSLGLTNTH